MMMWKIPLKACLLVLFVGSLCAQVIAFGVYVTKFAGSPEQLLATVGLAVGVIALLAIEAITVSVWKLADRFFAGTVFASGTRRWLRTISVAASLLVLPGIWMLLSMWFVGDGAPPVLYAAAVAVVAGAAAAALAVAILCEAFNDAVAARLELEGVI